MRARRDRAASVRCVPSIPEGAPVGLPMLESAQPALYRRGSSDCLIVYATGVL